MGEIVWGLRAPRNLRKTETYAKLKFLSNLSLFYCFNNIKSISLVPTENFCSWKAFPSFEQYFLVLPSNCVLKHFLICFSWDQKMIGTTGKLPKGLNIFTFKTF